MPRMVQVYSRYPKVGTDGRRWRYSDDLIKDQTNIFIPIHQLWSTCVYQEGGVVWSEEHSCSLERDAEGFPYLNLSYWDKQDAAQSSNLMKRKFWNNLRKIKSQWSYDHPLHRAAKYYWFEGVEHKTSNTCLPQLYLQGHHKFACRDSIVSGMLWTILYDRLPPISPPLHKKLSSLLLDRIEDLKTNTVNTIKDILWGGCDTKLCDQCAELAKRTWSEYRLTPDWGIDRDYLKTLNRDSFITLIPHTVSEIIVSHSFVVRETMGYPVYGDDSSSSNDEIMVDLATCSTTKSGCVKAYVCSKPFSGTKLNIELLKTLN